MVANDRLFFVQTESTTFVILQPFAGDSVPNAGLVAV
jgi:hypothetical protein